MPPRYSYWTILAGGLPTAFRAAEREDLLPTFNRIRDKHSDAEMKWFARGRLWDSPEAAQEDLQRLQARRDRDWRPGGAHRDPRKFKDAKREGKSGKRDGKHPQRPAGPRLTTDGKRPQRPTGPASTTKDRATPAARAASAARDTFRRDGKHPERPSGPASTTKGRATPAARAASASRDTFRRDAKPRGPRPQRPAAGRADRRGEGPPRKRQR